MATPTILIIPDRYKSGVLYSQLPESGAVDFGVTRATTAYRTNASGILESVASGVPRLDYPAAGGCPSLLVEPAATNLAILSTDYSGAGWAKTNVTLLEDRNQPDPFGGNDASIIRIDSSGGNLQRVITGSSSTQYSGAFWIKRIAGTGDCNLRVVENANIVVPVTNEWQRFTATRTSTSTSIRIGVGGATIGDEFAIYQGQVETGPVSTSDIITGVSTGTRNADVISKTGVSGFIGQASGTIYSEVDVRSIVSLKAIYQIDNGTGDNRLLLQISSPNVLTFFTTNGGLISAIASGTISTGIHKIGVGYSSANVSIFLDGAFLASGTTSNYPTLPLTNISLGSRIFSAVQGSFVNDRIRAAAIYTTRLDNAQLSALTTL